MTLEKLLFGLGYDGSPCFLRRGDGRFESEMGYGRIFRRTREPKDEQKPKRAPRWQVEGVYGKRVIRSHGILCGAFLVIPPERRMVTDISTIAHPTLEVR